MHYTAVYMSLNVLCYLHMTILLMFIYSRYKSLNEELLSRQLENIFLHFIKHSYQNMF